MLILTRNRGQQIFINDDIKIKILSVTRNGQVRLGIDAPQDYAVHREEIYILNKKHPGEEKNAKQPRDTPIEGGWI